MIRSAKEAKEIIKTVSIADRPGVFLEARGYLACLKEGPEVKALVEAAKNAVQYLEERGIRTHGTVGRTKILPALDKALAGYREETKP